MSLAQKTLDWCYLLLNDAVEAETFLHVIGTQKRTPYTHVLQEPKG